MSITIIDTPKTVDFCRNPLAFKVKGNKYIAISESYATWKITRTNYAIQVNNYLSFSFNGIVVTMKFVNFPDDSGSQINNHASLSQILLAFQNNYYLNDTFNIVLNGNAITATAKIKGTQYATSIGYSGNGFTINTVTPPVNPVIQSNYKILSKLLVEQIYNSGNYVETMEMLNDVDISGNAVININDKIRRTAFTGIDIPAFNQSIITKCTNTIKRYMMNFYEYYGALPIPHLKYSSVIYFAINGLIPFNVFPGYNFITDVAISKNFLSNMPDSIETWDKAQQYLYFFNWVPGLRSLTQYINIYYTDGSTYNKIINYNNAVYQYETFIIPTGISNLNLNTIDPTKTIDYYETYLKISPIIFGTNVYTKKQTYKRVNPPAISTVFLFENDFGVLETLLAGTELTELTVEKNLSQCELPYNYDVLDGSLISEVQNDYLTKTVNVFHKNFNEAEHIIEVLRNNNLYLQGGSNFYKCVILPDTYKIIDENDDLYSVQFKYRIDRIIDNELFGSFNDSFNDSF